MITSTSTLHVVTIDATIFGGFVLLLIVLGMFFYALLALDKGAPLLPWTARSRVAKAKADLEMAEIRVKREKADISLMALEPYRAQALKAIESGEPMEELTNLSGDKLREQAYGRGY